MSAFYELVGRLVVEFVRRRYRRQVRVVAAAGAGFAALAAVGVWAATREDEDA